MAEVQEDGGKPSEMNGDAVVGWLDREYIQKCLREGLQDPDLVIVDHEVLPATLRGENYASVVYKCKATDVSGKEHRTIIKCLPTNAVRQMFCNNAEIFRKEIDMYTVIFPDYEDMLLEKGMKQFWAKYYYSSRDGSKDTIVLEDIKPYGYVMRERRKGLNADHLEVVLAALARYHACSVAMKIRGPEAFQRKVANLFQEKLFTPDSENIKPWIESCIKSGSQVTRDWGGEKYTRIADKMEEWIPTIHLTSAQDFVPKEGAVLTHGDFWVNNMLFKYATSEEAESGSGKPVEVILLDFQIARHCSPVIDLLYLMVTSVTPETRKKHWERLVEEAYIKSFWRDLERLGHKADIRKGLYTSEWFESEFREHRMFILFTAISVLKAIVAPTEEAPDLDTLSEKDLQPDNIKDPFAKLLDNEVFQERFCSLIDYLDETGFFDQSPISSP